MRFLVLDGSHLLISIIERILDGKVDLEEVSTFDDALEALEQRPPEAVIANIGPDGLPWKDSFRTVCQEHSPKIPVLFESCVFHSPEEAGLGPLNHSCFFIEKPYPRLRSQGAATAIGTLQRVSSEGQQAIGSLTPVQLPIAAVDPLDSAHQLIGSDPCTTCYMKLTSKLVKFLTNAH